MFRFLLPVLALVLPISAWGQLGATAAQGKVPALNVQVTVATQQRPQRGSFYRKTMNIQGKATIEGNSRMLPIPALEATLLIITMDTYAKYTNHQAVYIVHAKQTLPVPAVTTGERRQFSFDESQVSFDAYRDESNVGGQVYKYYVFGLRDPETKELIDFKTNNAELANFVKLHQGKRNEYLKLAKGAKFPAEFK